MIVHGVPRTPSLSLDARILVYVFVARLLRHGDRGRQTLLLLVSPAMANGEGESSSSLSSLLSTSPDAARMGGAQSLHVGGAWALCVGGAWSWRMGDSWEGRGGSNNKPI